MVLAGCSFSLINDHAARRTLVSPGADWAATEQYNAISFGSCASRMDFFESFPVARFDQEASIYWSGEPSSAPTTSSTPLRGSGATPMLLPLQGWEDLTDDHYRRITHTHRSSCCTRQQDRWSSRMFKSIFIFNIWMLSCLFILKFGCLFDPCIVVSCDITFWSCCFQLRNGSSLQGLAILLLNIYGSLYILCFVVASGPGYYRYHKFGRTVRHGCTWIMRIFSFN